jgi:hypothetical protein
MKKYTMRNHKIYKDMYGVYIKADGQIFRPQINTQYAQYHDARLERESAHIEGITVKVKLKNALLTAIVGGEDWYGHGYVFGLKSEDCWMR